MNETYWFVGASYDAANDQPQVFYQVPTTAHLGSAPISKAAVFYG